MFLFYFAEATRTEGGEGGVGQKGRLPGDGQLGGFDHDDDDDDDDDDAFLEMASLEVAYTQNTYRTNTYRYSFRR